MAADFSGYTALVVDDYPLNVLLAKKMLERVSFNVRTATNGQEALDSIAEQRPDIMLLDLRMPVLDGFGTLERLRANEDTKDLPVVVFTAWSENENKIRSMELGANDWMPKPLHAESLYSSLKKLLLDRTA